MTARSQRSKCPDEPETEVSGSPVVRAQSSGPWVQGASATPLMVEVGGGLFSIDSVAGLGVGRCRVDGGVGGGGARRAGQDGVSMVARLRWREAISAKTFGELPPALDQATGADPRWDGAR